jgi:hypothetical protein
MVKQEIKKANANHGVIYAAYKFVINKIKAYRKRRYSKKVEKLITEAEHLSNLTGYKYFVMLYKGKLTIIPKQRVKKWALKGKLKPGITTADIEKRAIYVTKPKSK